MATVPLITQDLWWPPSTLQGFVPPIISDHSARSFWRWYYPSTSTAVLRQRKNYIRVPRLRLGGNGANVPLQPSEEQNWSWNFRRTQSTMRPKITIFPRHISWIRLPCYSIQTAFPARAFGKATSSRLHHDIKPSVNTFSQPTLYPRNNAQTAQRRRSVAHASAPRRDANGNGRDHRVRSRPRQRGV